MIVILLVAETWLVFQRSGKKNFWRAEVAKEKNISYKIDVTDKK